MDGIEEIQLIAEAQQDDPDAFGLLIEKHAPMIYNLCYRLSGADSEARDLSQDVFLKALKSIRTFRKESSFSTWLHQIAVNLWYDREKHRKKILFASLDNTFETRDGESLASQQIDPAPGAEEILACRERSLKIQKALSALPPDQRAVIVLKYLEDKSLEEISSICSCSIGTVSSRICRGLQAVRKNVKES
jgi:RNA polymerase sigma-70 factor (ECF subfamily)